MKLTFVYLLIFICIVSLNAMDDETISKIFEKYENGVVYVEQSIYFNSNDVQNENLFKRIEKEYKIKLLDRFITLGSGTGFFITTDGYFITNHHVIDNTEIEKIKKNLLNQIDNDFLSKIPSDILSYSEYSQVYDDFEKLLKYSEFQYRIVVGNTDTYVAELLKSDKELDVAILKVEGENFKALPIGNSDKLKVGNSVVAIGYPIPSTLFTFLKDFKSTMTTGSVSSIRTDTWGIQHTSSINPGNSGGPLINMKGEVIGVNVGGVPSASGMYFSIPSIKLTKWLRFVELDTVVSKNIEDAKGIGTKYKLNEHGYLEVGPMIFVDIDPGYDIYIDGKNMGRTPQLLKSLAIGESVIRIESEKEYIEQKILIKKDISDVFKYNPRMLRYKGKLFVNTNPMKAEVFIDGKNEGTSPLMLNNVISGKHKIEIKLNEYVLIEDEIIIIKNQLVEKEYKLKKGYQIKFSPDLPVDTTIEVKKGNFFYKYNISEICWFENGTWEVTIYSDILLKMVITATINNKDAMIEFEPKYVKSEVELKNLKKDSLIFIDNENITLFVKNNSFKAEVGTHSLEIQTKNYKPFKKDIEVEKGEKTETNIIYIRDYTDFKTSYKPIGVGLSIPGGIFTAIGLPLFVYSLGNYYGGGLNNINNFPDYSTYVNEKYKTIGLLWSGAVIGLIGLTMITISIPMFVIKKSKPAKKVTEKEVSFLINYNDSLALSVIFEL